MSRVLSKRRFLDGFFAFAIILMILSLVLLPTDSVEAAKEGVNLCINVIVPSLFPFFTLSTLAVEMGLIQGLGRLTERFMAPLFRVSGKCAGAFLLGILGGYPVGARTAISLYQSGQCSKTEAERLLSFCNNSGPAFILGVVGAGIFASSSAGLWLYGAHVAASILVGMLFRFYGKEQPLSASRQYTVAEHKSFSQVFPESVKNAFSGTLNICAFVIFFTVVIRLLFQTGILPFFTSLFSRFGMPESTAESLLTGLIEMTSGVWSLREMAGSMSQKLCMAAFILGWAGLSVHCQVLSFIGKSGLSTKTYFFGKLLHGVFSAILIGLLSVVLEWNVPVSAHLASQVSTIAGLNFASALTVSTLTAGTAFLVLGIISPGESTKTYGKSQHHRV